MDVDLGTHHHPCFRTVTWKKWDPRPPPFARDSISVPGQETKKTTGFPSASESAEAPTSPPDAKKTKYTPEIELLKDLSPGARDPFWFHYLYQKYDSDSAPIDDKARTEFHQRLLAWNSKQTARKRKSQSPIEANSTASRASSSA